MGARALLIELRWPDGRFHGVREGRGRGEAVPEWPPSPFRLFQALIAGAYGGRWAVEDPVEKDAAFQWLEALDPPAVAAPPRHELRPVTYYVPNNDLDAKGGDPTKTAEIRAAKTLRTTSFDRDRPVAYLWSFEGNEAPAQRIAELARRLHTLGHGIDAAFAQAEVLDLDAAEARLAGLGGVPHRPTPQAAAAANGGGALCPTMGSLASLRARYDGTARRFRRVGRGRKAAEEFLQPPKARFRTVAYDRQPARLLYELAPLSGQGRFAAWRLTDAATLAVAVRETMAHALSGAFPHEAERFVTGRAAGNDDKASRLRILPLPSVGHHFTDMSIRRVLVAVPPDHPIPLPDVQWALAGRELVRPDGELTGTILVPADDDTMLRRYGVGVAMETTLWRSVTPVALPRLGRVRSGAERAAAEASAAASLAAALRHAGVAMPIEAMRIQREPFDIRGARADAFQPDRFDRHALRHVEIRFTRPVAGPLAIGDGRWLGLGVMQAVALRDAQSVRGLAGIHAFTVAGGPPIQAAYAEALGRAARRAVMARAEAVAARRSRRRTDLPTFFTGHDGPRPADGVAPPAAGGHHAHLFFAVDPGATDDAPRLLVIAPHRADRSRPALRATRRALLDWLAEALDGFDDLRAGRLGRFSLMPATPGEDDPLLARSTVWTSLTPYRPTRHPRRGADPATAITQDLLREAARRGLPRPAVEVLAVEEGPRGGLSARLRLIFASAIAGPILLGAGSHFGAGLFTR